MQESISYHTDKIKGPNESLINNDKPKKYQALVINHSLENSVLSTESVSNSITFSS